MELTVNDATITVLPRTAAMIRQLLEHQREIERHATGSVRLEYRPREVELYLSIKCSRLKLDVTEKFFSDSRKTSDAHD